MDENQIQNLTDKAAQVATLADARNVAVLEERAAEAALLDKIVESVRPALRAICSRMRSSSTSSGLATDKQRESETFYEWRGLIVDGNTGPERDAPRDNSGQYEGAALCLREDGTWVDFYYVGSWSKWQGAGDHWHTATTREDWGDDIPVPTVDMQTTADVVRLWNVDRIIANIADALDRQLNGKSEQRTKTARERAAKLRALAELVKS